MSSSYDIRPKRRQRYGRRLTVHRHDDGLTEVSIMFLGYGSSNDGTVYLNDYERGELIERLQNV